MPTSSEMKTATMASDETGEAGERSAAFDAHDHDDISQQHEPQAVPEHPENGEQERPERKSVAHEREAVRIGQVSSARSGGSWTV